MKQADIVIATYNSADRIERTMQSLTRQTVPVSEWKLWVMNNNSTDDTAAVVKKYADSMTVEVVDVPQPGKSRAQNASIPYLTADIVLFTDDDVDLAPDWIEKMLAAAHDNPSCDVFTGKIVGKWEIEPPEDLKSWIPMGSTFAVHERESSGDCDPGMVWGPNMAYRRKVFDGGIRFNEKIGPTPAAFYAMGEDSEMAQRAAEKGHRVFYAADAVVIHTIKAATVNEDWVIRRAERLGYGRFVIEPKNPHPRILPTWVPMGAEVTARFLFWAALYPLTFLMPRSKRRFWTQWGFYFYRGLFKSWRDYAA